MTVTEDVSQTGGPPPVLAAPRAGSPQLGIASDPVITAHPLRLVNGYARVLLADGRSGWVPRDRLRRWAVSASVRMRCIPARMSNGLTEAYYAHPG